jgi:hypothetical protein
MKSGQSPTPRSRSLRRCLKSTSTRFS